MQLPDAFAFVVFRTGANIVDSEGRVNVVPAGEFAIVVFAGVGFALLALLADDMMDFRSPDVLNIIK